MLSVLGVVLNPQMATRLKKIGRRGAPKFVRREVTGVNERDRSWTYRLASIPARYSHENISAMIDGRGNIVDVADAIATLLRRIKTMDAH